MDEPYDIDDFSSKQRTLHSVISTNFVYVEHYFSGGNVFNKINWNIKGGNH